VRAVVAASQDSRMKLPVPFLQLPLLFDAGALQREIGAFDEGMWRRHPTGMPGNSALPLVAVDGDPARGDALDGPMRPTPALERSPYLRQVLASLDAVIGRVRLMRLAGNAEVRSHIDTDYYWHERVRVHVPIVTQPSVRFSCGDQHVNMAVGECWIFDTWRLHHVSNENQDARIHLVVDTVGGAGFWGMASAGRAHTAPRETLRARHVPPQAGTAAPIMFETVNSQSPMSYWELRGLNGFLFGEARPHPRVQAVSQLAGAFDAQWQTLWFRHGEDSAAQPEYQQLLDSFLAAALPLARGVPLRNDGDMGDALSGLLKRAVRRAGPTGSEEDSRSAPMPGAHASAYAAAHAPSSRRIERPVFIVSSPRSGSSLLFETLAKSPDACTIGGESHLLIDGIAALDAARRGFASNRLDAGDATPEIAAELRRRFGSEVFDRQLRVPDAGAVRLLEKTPKNSLRIPFLHRIFPDALFVYLYRDPREVLASMLEAWESGRFRTYPALPGWSGPPWSLLLTPGWRELIGRPLPQVVAAQWEATTRILLDDLAAVPAGQTCVARYDALIADPTAEIARICAAVGFAWDQPLDGGLPLANHTVSAPREDKWRAREAQITPLLAVVAETMQRAAGVASR
jgi:hypothetical protein